MLKAAWRVNPIRAVKFPSELKKTVKTLKTLSRIINSTETKYSCQSCKIVILAVKKVGET